MHTLREERRSSEFHIKLQFAPHRKQTNLSAIFREMIGIYFKGHTKHIQRMTITILMNRDCTGFSTMYEGWKFNSGNYLFTTDTK